MLSLSGPTVWARSMRLSSWSSMRSRLRPLRSSRLSSRSRSARSTYSWISSSCSVDQADRVVGDGHDVVHELGALLLPALREPRLLGQVGDLGGQVVQLLVERGEVRGGECLVHHASSSSATCPPCSCAPAAAARAPLSRMFQYIQRNIILPQWFISDS